MTAQFNSKHTGFYHLISRRSLNFDSSYSNNWPFRFKMTVYFKECATLKENNNIGWWSRWKCFKNKITNVCDDRKCWTAAESSCWNFEWTIWMTVNDDCMTSFDLCLKNYNNMHMKLMHILLLAVYMNFYRLFSSSWLQLSSCITIVENHMLKHDLKHTVIQNES